MSPMYERNQCEISVQERTRLTASMRRNFFTIWNGGDFFYRSTVCLCGHEAHLCKVHFSDGTVLLTCADYYSIVMIRMPSK
jgi:hypothetical protein